MQTCIVTADTLTAFQHGDSNTAVGRDTATERGEVSPGGVRFLCQCREWGRLIAHVLLDSSSETPGQGVTAAPAC